MSLGGSYGRGLCVMICNCHKGMHLLSSRLELLGTAGPEPHYVPGWLRAPKGRCITLGGEEGIHLTIDWNTDPHADLRGNGHHPLHVSVYPRIEREPLYLTGLEKMTLSLDLGP